MVNLSIAMPVSFFNLMTGIYTCITALLFNLAKALCANGSLLGLDACPGNLPLVWMCQHLSHILTCILTCILTHLLTHLLTCLLTHLLTHLLNHLLTCLCTCLLTRILTGILPQHPL